MLDSVTKKRIDNCRDILVGKLPSPSAQVEQITIALIYKFMDDMDRVTVEEYGGNPTFFEGDFEKYSWQNIYSPRTDAHQMLNLYAEGIQKMGQNPGLNPMFRSIFKDAFLPYRDPETLRLFLSTINEFSYEHSEMLGDAFEYLLSIMGSQGDAGQFRTPRHIIDFLVELVDPKIGETILDPACGTSGFLISAYKHILNSNKKDKPGDLLSSTQKKELLESINGYDISPDMVRLSSANLFLHGFTDDELNIHEYDTLSSEDRWNEYYDVIIANPPFMTPKGGIRPHNRFSVDSNRAEVLFTNYIMEHLTPKGRAGIVVPEGIIFQSGKAYVQLRKALVEKYLIGVISLPSGVFNPYSGVKTSILILDRELSQKTDKIFFGKVENDGYELSSQRRKIEKNDLPILANEVTEYFNGLRNGSVVESEKLIFISKEKVLSSNDIGLSSDRYNVENKIYSDKINIVDLVDYVYFQEGPGILSSQYTNDDGHPIVNVKNVRDGYLDLEKTKFVSNEIVKTKWNHFVINENDILFTTSGTIGRSSIVKKTDLPLLLNTSVVRFRTLDESKLKNTFLYRILRSQIFVESLLKFKTGSAQFNVGPSHIKQLKIPLPAIGVQEEIARELEQYQKVIDGAKQVVDNYKPSIDIDESWKKVELGEVVEVLDSKRKPISKFNRIPGEYPYYGATGIVDYVNDFLFDEKLVLVGEDGAKWGKGDQTSFIISGKNWVNNHAHVLKPNRNLILDEILVQQLNSQDLSRYITGITVPKLNQRNLLTIPIFLPSMEVQNELVGELQKERQIIEGNNKLIEIYTQKIEDRINKIWGE